MKVLQRLLCARSVGGQHLLLQTLGRVLPLLDACILACDLIQHAAPVHLPLRLLHLHALGQQVVLLACCGEVRLCACKLRLRRLRCVKCERLGPLVLHHLVLQRLDDVIFAPQGAHVILLDLFHRRRVLGPGGAGGLLERRDFGLPVGHDVMHVVDGGGLVLLPCIALIVALLVDTAELRLEGVDLLLALLPDLALPVFERGGQALNLRVPGLDALELPFQLQLLRHSRGEQLPRLVERGAGVGALQLEARAVLGPRRALLVQLRAGGLLLALCLRDKVLPHTRLLLRILGTLGHHLARLRQLELLFGEAVGFVLEITSLLPRDLVFVLQLPHLPLRRLRALLGGLVVVLPQLHVSLEVLEVLLQHVLHVPQQPRVLAKLLRLRRQLLAPHPLLLQLLRGRTQLVHQPRLVVLRLPHALLKCVERFCHRAHALGLLAQAHGQDRKLRSLPFCQLKLLVL
mmetsp:Transcript_23495/g.73720  ORF Transcript_23495/g.73720 Transcript_23495/m.73720 type:complete len:459 (-) Transcript_23495:1153-2529(-)